jgi:two-component system NarL family sensor kinase
MRATRIVTVASAGCAFVIAAAALGFGAASAPASDPPSLVVLSVAIVATAGVALLIGVRVPGQPVGLILALASLAYSTAFLAEEYGRFVVLDEHPGLPGGDWAVLWANAAWPLMFAGVIAIAFVFPNGRLPTSRWRPAAVVSGVCVAGTVVVGLFTPEPFDKPFQDVANPMPALPDALAAVQLVLLAGVAASVVAAGMAARYRFVRSVQPQRQQLLWLAASAWLIPVTLAVCLVDVVVPGQLDWLVLTLLLLTITAVPASIAVALLRYRLYDLDRLVNRALVYGVLTALVLAAYYLTVLGLGGLLPAVNRLRVWLQHRVDRYMYGDRADPYTGISRLAARLEASVTPQMALRTIVDTVADSLKVPFVAIDLRGADGLQRAAVHPGPAPHDPLEVPLTFQGEDVGALVVGPRTGDTFTTADRRLLEELARHAGAVVHATRLTWELQASRERLVAAQEEVRRRLRRDLHDGLGPTLAGAVFQVDIARDALPADAASADVQLAALRTQLQAAVESIRGMSYALRPPALDNGLVPALAEQVSSMNARGAGPHVTFTAPTVLPPLTSAVEVAAYRIAMEAVTNAARHSGARTCAVRLGLNGGLEVEVTDDGRAANGTQFRPGVGISSMRERADELGATLSIEQRASGTRVHTVLPVGAE